MRCRVCGAELADGMPRCPRCGQPVRPGHTPLYPHGNPAPYPPPSYIPGTAAPVPPGNPAETTGEIPAVPPSVPPYSGAPAWPVSGAGGFQYPVQARRRRPWLLLVVLLVVGATGVVGIGLAAASTISPHHPTAGATAAHPTATAGTATTESGSGSAPGQGAAQASALNDLLTASGTSRATLGTAIAQVQSCDASSDPLSTMDSVIRDRTAQLRTAQSLAVDGLPGGDNLRTLLIQLLQKSAEADGDYEAWAQQVLDSACAPDAGAAQLTAASTASSEATTLKKTFLTSWNPIAARYGLTQRQETDL